MDTTKIVNGLQFGNIELTLAGSAAGVEIDPTVPAFVKAITEDDILNWNNKAEKSEVPNVSDFIMAMIEALKNYYTKTETDNKLSTIPKFDVEPVDELPIENISTTTIYLLNVEGENPNLYEEYIYVDGAWELLGTAKVDLTGYVKDTDYATSTKAGLVKVNAVNGLTMHNDVIVIDRANQTEIDQRATQYKPIVPSTLDYAIKSGLTQNSLTLTENEKDKAQNWLGVPRFLAIQLEDGSYSLTINTEV